VHNILERKSVEDKLKVQSIFLDKMKALVDNFYYVQKIEDTATNIFLLAEFASKLGYSKEEIRRLGNLSIPVLVHPDDFPRITEYFQKTIFNNIVNEIQFRLKHRNNSWKWFSNRCILLEEKGVRKTLNIVREITLEKKMEESFFIAEKRLQAISSNPYFGLVILSSDGEIIDMNLSLERLMGYTKEEISLLRPAEYMSLSGIRIASVQLEKLKTGEIDSFQIETIAYPKNRGELWCYIVFSAVQNVYGTLEYIACSLIDISETKLFEKNGDFINRLSKLKIVSK